jgi:hypothetical protein
MPPSDTNDHRILPNVLKDNYDIHSDKVLCNHDLGNQLVCENGSREIANITKRPVLLLNQDDDDSREVRDGPKCG